jgi:hypothetical protein
MLGRAIFLTNLAQLEDLIVPVGLVVTFGLQQVSVPFFPLSLSLSLFCFVFGTNYWEFKSEQGSTSFSRSTAACTGVRAWNHLSSRLIQIQKASF